jgi:uncharacterized lipoprotein
MKTMNRKTLGVLLIAVTTSAFGGPLSSSVSRTSIDAQKQAAALLSRTLSPAVVSAVATIYTMPVPHSSADGQTSAAALLSRPQSYETVQGSAPARSSLRESRGNGQAKAAALLSRSAIG